MKIAEGGSKKKYTEKVTVKSSVMFALAAKCDTKLTEEEQQHCMGLQGYPDYPLEHQAQGHFSLWHIEGFI